MAASDALHALEQLLRGNAAQAVVADIDWSVLKALHESRRVRPLLAHLGNEEDFSSASGGLADSAYGHGRGSGRGGVSGRQGASGGAGASDRRGAAGPGGASGSPGSPSGPTLLERLAQAPATHRRELLTDFVRAEAAAVLGTGSETEVAPDVGLFEMGMDSLMSVELRRRLERGAARKLPSTLTFNYPNVAALAGFLERELTPSLPQGAGAPSTTTGAAAPGMPAATANAATANGSPNAKAATAVLRAQSAVTNAASTTASSTAAPASTDNLDELSDEELEKRLLARLSETR
jgi:acyl carrier protein